MNNKYLKKLKPQIFSKLLFFLTLNLAQNGEVLRTKNSPLNCVLWLIRPSRLIVKVLIGAVSTQFLPLHSPE